MVILVLNLEKSLMVIVAMLTMPPPALSFKGFKGKAILGRPSNNLKKVRRSNNKTPKAALHLKKKS